VRIAAGEPDAVAECMRRHGAIVWSMARSKLQDLADAEDATQEIFLELWRCARRFDPTAGSEVAFIRTIAQRKLIDRLRAKGRQPIVDEFDEAVHCLDGLEHVEAAETVDAEMAARALEQLAVSQREILLMGVVQGMTHSEIARVTGKPIGTVKAQLRRGLLKLRALIETGTPSLTPESSDCSSPAITPTRR
jgi:RNA polymerase sigma-70 factor (ECF subfamily)